MKDFHGMVGGDHYSLADMMFSQNPACRNLQKLGVTCLVILKVMLSPLLVKAASPAKDPAPEAVNQALGIQLFSPENLWDESDQSVAKRLGLPRESLTSVESGFRTYQQNFILGVKSYSLFLQGKAGKVAAVAILFANKGDVATYATTQDQQGIIRAAAITKQTKEYHIYISPQMLEAYRSAIRHDQEEIRHQMEGLFGESKPATLGANVVMQEQGECWDWKGVSFFLAAPRNEYIVLRLLPSSSFEKSDADREAFQKSKELLPGRVKHFPNGDVVITDIPMVNQGPKGYCVPATFERVLRYYGLQADMNLLANGGQTAAGGGTWLSDICNASYLVVAHAGGKVTRGMSGVRIADVAPYIDKGEPVIWQLSSSKEFNSRANQRTKDRQHVADWNEWKEKVLEPARAQSSQLAESFDYHVGLIIGYNRSTGELAISDSWGPAYEKRWITQEEAIAVSKGETSVIGW
jgi:hypothetical protein